GLAIEERGDRAGHAGEGDQVAGGEPVGRRGGDGDRIAAAEADGAGGERGGGGAGDGGPRPAGHVRAVAGRTVEEEVVGIENGDGPGGVGRRVAEHAGDGDLGAGDQAVADAGNDDRRGVGNAGGDIVGDPAAGAGGIVAVADRAVEGEVVGID